MSSSQQKGRSCPLNVITINTLVLCQTFLRGWQEDERETEREKEREGERERETEREREKERGREREREHRVIQ